MDKDIYEHFSKTVEDYDTTVDNVVMKNDDLQRELVDSLEFDVKDSLNILDIGCGTGHGMLLVLKKFPNSTVVGMDFSEIMIKKARKNLLNYQDRIKLIEGDFVEEDIGKNYDVVLSGVTIHNVSHEEKKVLFKKIYHSLNENGVFINGDFIEGETDKLNDELRETYKTYLKDNLDGEELKVWLKHAFEEDKPMKLSEQFKMLKNLGFKEVKLLWQFSNEAVYVAKK